MSLPNHAIRLILLPFALAVSVMSIPSNSCAQGQVAPTAPAKPPEIHANLEKVVHPKRVKVGDAVTARTTEPTKLKDGTEIPKGTHILGSVTEIKLKADKEGPSKIGLLFDKAQLKDGRVVPLIMALVSVAPPWEPGGLDPMGADKMAGSTARTADMQQAAGAGGEVGLTSSTSVRGTKPVSAAAMQPGVCYLPDIKIAIVSLGPAGTILESAKSTVYLDSGSRLLLQVQ